MSKTDLRGFRYGLSAARERAGHRVDVAFARLAACQRELTEARARETELESQLQLLAGQGRPTDGARLQPQVVALASAQLQAVHVQVAAARKAVNERQRAFDEARQVLQDERAQQEAFERHREAALTQFQVDAARQRQAAIDDDWLARRRWQEARG